jgi:hypothetical protein
MAGKNKTACGTALKIKKILQMKKSLKYAPFSMPDACKLGSNKKTKK